MLFPNVIKKAAYGSLQYESDEYDLPVKAL